MKWNKLKEKIINFFYKKEETINYNDYCNNFFKMNHLLNDPKFLNEKFPNGCYKYKNFKLMPNDNIFNSFDYISKKFSYRDCNVFCKIYLPTTLSVERHHYSMMNYQNSDIVHLVVIFFIKQNKYEKFKKIILNCKDDMSWIDIDQPKTFSLDFFLENTEFFYVYNIEMIEMSKKDAVFLVKINIKNKIKTIILPSKEIFDLFFNVITEKIK